MLERYDDCKGRCACYADAATGLIKHEWKRLKTEVCIPIGGEFKIHRDATVTVIRRIDAESFEVISSFITA